MTVDEIAKLGPRVIQTTTNALKRAIEFRNGRGAMLRALRPRDPGVAALIRKLEGLE